MKMTLKEISCSKKFGMVSDFLSYRGFGTLMLNGHCQLNAPKAVAVVSYLLVTLRLLQLAKEQMTKSLNVPTVTTLLLTK